MKDGRWHLSQTLVWISNIVVSQIFSFRSEISEFCCRSVEGRGGGGGGEVPHTKSLQIFYRVCIWAPSLQHQARIFFPNRAPFQASTPLGWTPVGSKTELITGKWARRRTFETCKQFFELWVRRRSLERCHQGTKSRFFRIWYGGWR